MITPLTPYPAALFEIEKARIMVVADLHIGWEVALSKEGIHVPTQTPKLLAKLVELISKFKPERLLILGDIKHSVATAEKAEWHDVPDFFSELKKHIDSIKIIRGNHDGNLEPLLPETTEILPSTGIVLGDNGFFHGHRWPSPSLLKCKTLVMGHVHPVVAFRDPSGFRVTKQVWVKARCYKTELTRTLLQRHKKKFEKSPEQGLFEHYGIKARTSELFIMPSFNDFLGGRPLNERKSGRDSKSRMIAGPMLRSEAVDMRKAEIFLLDGTFLGNLEQLTVLS
jgi:putative SbcD/Mre11-related phosphoesterase